MSPLECPLVCVEDSRYIFVLCVFRVVLGFQVFWVYMIHVYMMQAPDVMRSVCLALNLVATALGGYFSAFLMSVVDRHTTWLNDLDDPKTSHLDQYFFLLAGFMLMNTVAFVGVASRYKYKVVKHRAPLPLVGGQQPHAVRQALTAAGTLVLP